MVLLLIIAAAWARCSDDWFPGAPERVASSGPTLPEGAAPWIAMLNTEPREFTLRDADGRRVRARRVGRERVSLVPWRPLRAGHTYSVLWSRYPVFSFTVAGARDRVPPSGGALRAWTSSAFSFEEGLALSWTLAVSALDEDAWFEADLWHEGSESAHERIVDRVWRPGDGPLAQDRFTAMFSPETVRALGAPPESALILAAGPCSGRRLPAGAGPLLIRVRYLDVSGNLSPWSPTWRLEGAGGPYEAAPSPP